jgi:hypothetical protein
MFGVNLSVGNPTRQKKRKTGINQSPSFYKDITSTFGVTAQFKYNLATTCALPAGAAVGDYCLLLIETAGDVPVFTSPDTWTLIGVMENNLTNHGADTTSTYVYGRTRQTGDASVVIAANGNRICMFMFGAFRNVDPVTPVNAFAITNPSDTVELTVLNFPDLTTIGPKSMIVFLAASKNPPAPGSVSALTISTTQTYDTPVAISYTGGGSNIGNDGGITFKVGYATKAAVGALPSVTGKVHNTLSKRMGTMILALQPAPA